jgi:hypothetical protein
MGGRFAIGLVAVLGLTASAACGGDDDNSSATTARATTATSGATAGTSGSSGGASRDDYVAVLKESMMSSGDEDGFALTGDQADCMAPKWIDTIGVDTLQAKGIEPDDIGAEGSADLTTLGLSEEQGNDLYAAFGKCDVDVKSLFIKSMSPDLSAEDEQCLEDNFDDALMKQILVTTLTKGEDALDGDEELTGKLLAVFSKCPGAVPQDSPTTTD